MGVHKVLLRAHQKRKGNSATVDDIESETVTTMQDANAPALNASPHTGTVQGGTKQRALHTATEAAAVSRPDNAIHGFIHHVLASGSTALARELLLYLAQAWQHAGRRAEWALVIVDASGNAQAAFQQLLAVLVGHAKIHCAMRGPRAMYYIVGSAVWGILHHDFNTVVARPPPPASRAGEGVRKAFVAFTKVF